MTDSRDFGRMALDLREALDTYSREELADLLTHIVRVYVIEGNSSVSMDGQASAGMQDMQNLSFAQVILRLQMSLPHEELRRLQVSGSRVWVESQGREIALTDDGPNEMPPDPEVIEAPPAPAPERSYEPDPWETGGRTAAPTPAPVAQNSESSPRVERVRAEPEPWGGTPSVSRRTTPGAVAPRSAMRDESATRTPGVTMEEVGSVQRPGLDLRTQPEAPARLPGAPPRRRRPSWSAEPTSDETTVPDRSKDEDVGDVSERFSLLELD